MCPRCGYNNMNVSNLKSHLKNKKECMPQYMDLDRQYILDNYPMVRKQLIKFLEYNRDAMKKEEEDILHISNKELKKVDDQNKLNEKVEEKKKDCFQILKFANGPSKYDKILKL